MPRRPDRGVGLDTDLGNSLVERGKGEFPTQPSCPSAPSSLTGSDGERVHLGERLALRPAEVARALGISERTLRKWMREEALPFMRLDGVVLIPRGELERWMEARVAAARRTDGLAAEILSGLG
jgi:excisionase family DNA binding protein